ncbi:hypothetical protein OS493_027030 [Desmophyllum pertusum]|uniref:MAM domain-containing protein n=1 Tax=Desmophyllum pertusum TaxID=174260 RepID=A0A9W9YP28_9CNID|nr:hypothetical protein OS493_027030 [Desmophyllum pertusum]
MEGYYMYIEATNPATGNNAKLVLSVSGNRELSCLTFYYHMYGYTMGTLNVFSGNAVVFNTSGNHGNYWIMVKRTIFLDKTVTFEGTVGSSYTGDLAIDDVSISSGSCYGPTTYPTIPPSTRSPGVSPSLPPYTLPGASPSLPPYTLPEYSSTTKPSSSKPSTSKSTITPKEPSTEEIQESVMMEIRDLDMKKWDIEMKYDFKREVARVATEYCAADGSRCQLTETSSRRRRSSDNMVFSADMVHILLGYPMQSPEDPLMTLLAFYLQLPQGFSDNVITKDILQAIVKSDMSSIEGSMGSTISSVQPLASTADTKEDEENAEESKPTNVVIGASVGGVLLFVVIVALGLRFLLKGRVHSKEKVEEDVVEGNDGVCRGSAMNKLNNNAIAYDNNAYITVEQAIELKCTNHTRSTKNVPVKTSGKHHPWTSNGLYVPTNHSSVNEGFQESKERANDSTDGVVLSFQNVPAEMKE